MDGRQCNVDELPFPLNTQVNWVGTIIGYLTWNTELFYTTWKITYKVIQNREDKDIGSIKG